LGEPRRRPYSHHHTSGLWAIGSIGVPSKTISMKFLSCNYSKPYHSNLDSNIFWGVSVKWSHHDDRSFLIHCDDTRTVNRVSGRAQLVQRELLFGDFLSSQLTQLFSREYDVFQCRVLDEYMIHDPVFQSVVVRVILAFPLISLRAGKRTEQNSLFSVSSVPGNMNTKPSPLVILINMMFWQPE